ncbi:DUF5063 domain-containing protein [Cognatilysobacter lacus]|uniref:DUF5063 domain-containing protein n=1 Tax=Cognatilysobacter lacus TaxID=1643323 RepID=UPI0016594E2D|nr:DUF5063 domain-containing protein [Lysobacter lacus]
MQLSPEVEAFKSAAETYCAWLEAPPGSSSEERLCALRHLTRLYAAALELPNAEPEDSDPPDLPESYRLAVRQRLSTFPVGMYWQVYDPFVEEPDGPGSGSLTDDLEDTYADLKEGLECFGTHPNTAIFNWRLLFTAHWGAHVVSAIRALHWYDPA